jgi:uncharacterized OB-fold protein
MEVPRHWRLNKERYGLIGVICPHCGEKLFPPRDVCPKCGNNDVSIIESFDGIEIDLKEMPFIAQAVLAEGV